MSARQRVTQARTWAAPQLDRAGKAVQERVAPRAADMLRGAARRVEPDRARRRWPLVAAAVSALAAGASAIAYLLIRRENPAAKTNGEGAQADTEAAAEKAPADADGQVRTP